MENKELEELFYEKLNIEDNLKALAQKLDIANRTDKNGTVWPTFEDYVKYGDMFINIEPINQTLHERTENK